MSSVLGWLLVAVAAALVVWAAVAPPLDGDRRMHGRGARPRSTGDADARKKEVARMPHVSIGSAWRRITEALRLRRQGAPSAPPARARRRRRSRLALTATAAPAVASAAVSVAPPVRPETVAAAADGPAEGPSVEPVTAEAALAEALEPPVAVQPMLAWWDGLLEAGVQPSADERVRMANVLGVIGESWSLKALHRALELEQDPRVLNVIQAVLERTPSGS